MAKLSRRQAQIVVLLVNGDDQKTAARRLGIATSTARNHLRAARARVGARSTLELAMQVAEELGNPH